MLENYGNTVSSTLPILISDLRQLGKISHGTQSLLIGFGVGWSWWDGMERDMAIETRKLVCNALTSRSWAAASPYLTDPNFLRSVVYLLKTRR